MFMLYINKIEYKLYLLQTKKEYRHQKGCFEN